MTRAVFNPWHDMALASGTPHYQPPRSAMIMAEDLSTLSRFWEEEGKVTVWGWDQLIVHLLQKQGIARELMPADEQLAHIRRLSSRHTAVKALKEMSSTFVSHWCENEDEAQEAILRCATPYALLKSPWSCSGKGLMRTDRPWQGWMHNIIQKQGGIVVEPFYEDKACDFAMEYGICNGNVRYDGLSVFDTNGGAYTGNLLGSEEWKLARIGLTKTQLEQLETLHIPFLEREIAPYYSGPVGIDMMLMADGTVHPCVEINLRRTMGWVALRLEERIKSQSQQDIWPSLPARFVVSADGSTPPADAMLLTPKGKQYNAYITYACAIMSQHDTT